MPSPEEKCLPMDVVVQGAGRGRLRERRSLPSEELRLSGGGERKEASEPFLVDLEVNSKSKSSKKVSDPILLADALRPRVATVRRRLVEKAEEGDLRFRKLSRLKRQAACSGGLKRINV